MLLILMPAGRPEGIEEDAPVPAPPLPAAAAEAGLREGTQHAEELLLELYPP